MRRVLTTHNVTEPGRWIDPDTGFSGPTMPYTDSPATALGVVEGRLIAPSRDEMQREFATTEAAPQPDLEAQDITALIGATATDLHRAIFGNSLPTTDLAVRAAVVVTAHIALRDGFLRLGVGHELAAGRIWTRIAAHHRGRVRAELLTMAAVSYYCGEDTVRAGMALTHAAAATRDDDSALPRLATMHLHRAAGRHAAVEDPLGHPQPRRAPRSRAPRCSRSRQAGRAATPVVWPACEPDGPTTPRSPRRPTPTHWLRQARPK